MAVIFHRVDGVVKVLTSAQVASTVLEKVAAIAQRKAHAKFVASVGLELTTMHPRLGSAGSQFAGWQGRAGRKAVPSVVR